MDMHATKHPTMNVLTVQEPIVMDIPFGETEDGEIWFAHQHIDDLCNNLPHGASKSERSDIEAYLEQTARGE